ncbi:MAG: hypothetical protein ACU0CA_10045 [Paracoccaceae bacterium]
MDAQTNTFLINMYTSIIGNTLRTVFFGQIATMAIIVFADVSQYKIALTVLILSLTVFGALRARGPIDMLEELSKDLTADFGGTNYGKALKQTPFGMFKIVILITLLAIAVTQIWVLW